MRSGVIRSSAKTLSAAFNVRSSSASGSTMRCLSALARATICCTEPWVSDGAAGGAAGAGANSAEHDALDKLVSEQLAERAEARKSKDFARADAIRDALGAAGIAIEDGPQGSTWSLK